MIREMTGVEAEVSAGRDPSEAEIRQRAYEIYLRRNGAPGNAVVDWLQAESELRARMAAENAPTLSVEIRAGVIATRHCAAASIHKHG